MCDRSGVVGVVVLERDLDLRGLVFFFFNDTATTEIYTLSLHDALPISAQPVTPAPPPADRAASPASPPAHRQSPSPAKTRSEEHTSELQSQSNLVCRLLLEKKKNLATRHSKTTSLLHICPPSEVASCVV